jgi:bromodomain-containing factor 1
VPTTNGHNEAAVEVNSAIEPVTNLPSGIQPVSSFLPDPDVSSALAADTTSIPAALEAPTSDVREEPVITHFADDTNKAAQESEKTGEDKNISQTQTDGDAMDISQQETQPITQDAMDVRESTEQELAAPEKDSNVETSSIPESADLALRPNASPSVQEDTEMAEAPSTGKVRAREDDDETPEPLAKRTKVEDGEEEAMAATESSQVTHESASAGDATATTSNTASGRSKEDPLYPKFDSEPMTPSQHRELMQKVRNAKKIKSAMHFNKPVDWKALGLPTYPQIVPNPMDLGTIENKLKANQYGSVDDFLHDLNLMVKNCYTFNGRDHQVSHAAADVERYITDSFSKGALDRNVAAPEKKKEKRPTIMAPPPAAVEKKETRRKSVPTPVEKPQTPASATAASPSQAFALGPDGMPNLRRNSTAQDGRPKREIRRTKPKDLTYTTKPKSKKAQLELKFCGEILADVKSKKHAKFNWPFLVPVDPVALNIPSYFNIIRKPMDISTMENKLKSGSYANAKDFESDFRLMLANCFKFNPPEELTYGLGKEMEQLFNNWWSNKQDWMEKNAPASEPQSSGEEEEEESSEEEEEAVSGLPNDLAAIQRQIAELSSRAQDIIAKTMQSQNEGKGRKEKKTKTGKSKTKKAAALPAAPAKKSKKTRVVPLTFQQKQEISERISELNQTEMDQAIQIIRNGVPHLRVSHESHPTKLEQIPNHDCFIQDVNDAELEIDMEIIPDDVLRQLHSYIRKVRPPPKQTSIDTYSEDEDFSPPKRSKPPTKRKNKPMGKKEQEESIAAIERQLASFSGGLIQEGSCFDSRALSTGRSIANPYNCRRSGK